MRTITQNLKERLVAQSEEAKLQGLTKTASHLTNVTQQVSVRKNGESYTYSNEDFESDVENALWGAVVRFADFHNVSIDGAVGQNIVEKIAKDLISELRVKTGTVHGVGAYESNVPGESKQTVILSVEEND